MLIQRYATQSWADPVGPGEQTSSFHDCREECDFEERFVINLEFVHKEGLSEKCSLMFVLAVSAAREILPPAIVFKGECSVKDICLHGCMCDLSIFSMVSFCGHLKQQNEKRKLGKQHPLKLLAHYFYENWMAVLTSPLRWCDMAN